MESVVVLQTLQATAKKISVAALEVATKISSSIARSKNKLTAVAAALALQQAKNKLASTLLAGQQKQKK